MSVVGCCVLCAGGALRRSVIAAWRLMQQGLLRNWQLPWPPVGQATESQRLALLCAGAACGVHCHWAGQAGPPRQPHPDWSGALRPHNNRHLKSFRGSLRAATPQTKLNLPVWSSTLRCADSLCLNAVDEAARETDEASCAQMGEVLAESARLAVSWIRAHASQLPLLSAASSVDAAALGPAAAEAGGTTVGDTADPTCWDVHIHLPAGAIPKVCTIRGSALLRFHLSFARVLLLTQCICQSAGVLRPDEPKLVFHCDQLLARLSNTHWHREASWCLCTGWTVGGRDAGGGAGEPVHGAPRPV